MLVHEIAVGEEADRVADIGKHKASRTETTISPLGQLDLTGHSLDLV